MKKSEPLYALLALVSLSAGLLSSCCKTVDCTPGYADISFVDMSTTDIDTLYLRRYKLNTNFADKIDTAIYRLNQNLLISAVRRDTIILRPLESSTITKTFFVEAGFDYELVMPATGKISRITNITMSNIEERFCGMAKRLCYAQIQSSKVDAVAYNVGVVIKN